ncbi:MAG: transaldolase [Acidobacteriia bacterium]|nr:transaldolase [Terriglobia bacterium]
MAGPKEGGSAPRKPVTASQSLWLDSAGRGLITSGELLRLVQSGVRGLTTSPASFEKALTGGDYDAPLRRIVEVDTHVDTVDLYERLAIEDVQKAADILREVYESSAGEDGWVSLGVAPHRAFDTDTTIDEAHRLWDAIARPNVMISIPATTEGVLALETLIAEGINVNATLILSPSHYEAVILALLHGLEKSPNPAGISSVASVFVSRLDTAVDMELERIGTDDSLSLRGKVAVANCRVIYRRFEELLESTQWLKLAESGARMQRLLWASTTTENLLYSDVVYVNELVGPFTINSLSPATLQAYRDHGSSDGTLRGRGVFARQILTKLARTGIDFDFVTETVQQQGISELEDSYNRLLQALDEKRRKVLETLPAFEQFDLESTAAPPEEISSLEIPPADIPQEPFESQPDLAPEPEPAVVAESMESSALPAEDISPLEIPLLEASEEQSEPEPEPLPEPAAAEFAESPAPPPEQDLPLEILPQEIAAEPSAAAPEQEPAPQPASPPAPAQDPVEKRLAGWQEENFAGRLWERDYTLWSANPAEISNRLGWLSLPESMLPLSKPIARFVQDIRAAGYDDAVILGMGGSSLAPEVFAATFPRRKSFCNLHVLDSTHPDAVLTLESSIDLARTLFIVSSKSGTTIEPLSLMNYFWARLGEEMENPGKNFIAITDPGTALVKEAKSRGFRHIFETVPDVGGRYSALTHFGLVPAALIGVPLPAFLESAARMAQSCSAAVPVAENPALALGAAIAEFALAGRDKLTFVASRSLALLPSWIEQLIAESTGKHGHGIIPVVGEPLGPPEVYGPDRVFVLLRNAEDQLADPAPAIEQDSRLAALEAAGHPVLRISVANAGDLGQEFFRWELATATAGAALGVQPFDQPDVEAAKQLARKAMTGGAPEIPGAEPVFADDPAQLTQAVSAWLAQTSPAGRAADYIAIQAYLAPTPSPIAALAAIQKSLRDRTRLAVTVGFGPRFLHSTGQLHKGGPDSGLFLQLIDTPCTDLPVPNTGFTFAQLIQAQALGDFQALSQLRRRVLRLHLGPDPASTLTLLNSALLT